MSNRTEQFVLDLAAKGFVDPLTKRSAFKMTRLAVLTDGTTKPVLDILAERRFTTWDEDQFPFWIDGDMTNETLVNVGLATRSSNGTRRVRSSFGVPAGTKEYMKKWRAANKDRVKASQKKYSDKQRDALAAAVEVAEQTEDPLLAKLLTAVKGKEENA